MTQWGLDTLFNPAKRHMDDEKRRLQSTREEVGDASGGKRIDLESGAVVISRPDGTDATGDEQATEARRRAEERRAANRRTETAAQTRARERRERRTKS